MPGLHRRRFLAGAGALVAAPVVRRLPLPATRQRSAAPFSWGIASFDPTDASVLLWTRVDANPDERPVALRWVVAADDDLRDIVAEGAVEAHADAGWCAHVEVTELPAGRIWWYAFTHPDGERSPVGRTRTLPTDRVERLRLGVASCSRYAAGGFAAYRALAEREVDLVVHLGDYVYEDGGESVRAHEPAHELRSLDDYRTRYAQHRADPDLQALHARHAMVASWDDHEVAGNAWRDGATAHDDERHGPWEDRRRAALQAHAEWLPGRTIVDEDHGLRAWRALRLGALAELVVLDTRLWGRDRQPDSPAEVDGTGRSLLGTDQAAFAADRLGAADRPPWVLLANQVMLHPLRIPIPDDALAERVRDEGFLVVDGEALNPDQWDGYPEARDRLVSAIGDRGGVVVLTGDVHSSWAWEGPAGGDEPAMVELVAPSISSAPFGSVLPIPAAAAEAGLRGLPDLAFVEIQSNGYLLVDLTADRVQGEWWYVDPGDAASQRFGAGRTAPLAPPMALTEVDEPTDDPVPPSTLSTTTVAPVPGEPTADDGDDRAIQLVGGAGAVLVGAGVATALALRRRRA